MKNLKPFFVENSRVPRLLSYIAPININAITLGFIVFSRGKMDEKTKRHETIHFQQFLETLFIGFLILYFYDWVTKYFEYSWNLLDKSLVFVLAGIILVSGGILLERGRKVVLKHIEQE